MSEPKDDLVVRLRHASQNTKDEYQHELTGRAADRIEAQAKLIEGLQLALDEADQKNDALTHEWNAAERRGYLRGVDDAAKVLDAAEVDECVRLRNVRQRLNTAASGNRPIIAPLNLSAP